MQDITELEEQLSKPTTGVIDTLANLQGDVMVLGAAGKMGPTLTRMAKRASDATGAARRVIGVSRYSNPDEQSKLEAHGIETIRADLLDESEINALPDVPNIVYMVGMKFGSTDNEALTWAINVHLPALVCRKFPKSRLAVFSTGNVYGPTASCGNGSVESDTPNPVGEYAMSCLGRERIFEHFSKTQGTDVTIIRLNYATEMRYGVLVDIARKVWDDQPIDLTMGYVNVIWQGDANAMALQSLAKAASPPLVLNVSGPRIFRVRDVAEQFGSIMKKRVSFQGEEDDKALLGDGQLGYRLFGRPQVELEQLIEWSADWVMRDGESLNKPTHFEVTDGKF